MKYSKSHCLPVLAAVCFILFCGPTSAFAAHEMTDSSQNGVTATTQSESAWNLFLPAILRIEPPPPPPGKWRPKNSVCCLIPSGKLTMYMTHGDTTLSSATTSCFSNPSIPDYVSIAPGENSFYWHLSGPCSSKSGVHTQVIESGYRYTFVLTYENEHIYIVTNRYDDTDHLLDSAGASEITKSKLEIPSSLYTKSSGQCSSVKID